MPGRFFILLVIKKPAALLWQRDQNHTVGGLFHSDLFR